MQRPSPGRGSSYPETTSEAKLRRRRQSYGCRREAERKRRRATNRHRYGSPPQDGSRFSDDRQQIGRPRQDACTRKQRAKRSCVEPAMLQPPSAATATGYRRRRSSFWLNRGRARTAGVLESTSRTGADRDDAKTARCKPSAYPQRNSPSSC